MRTRCKRFAGWLDGDQAEPLGAVRDIDLRAWAIKTHMLLCYIDGNADHFDDDSFQEEYVVPPATPARHLYDDRVNAEALATVNL
ncbi:MAG: hypothetical protein ACRCYU_07345 [Nocardioides sp.]